MRVSRVLMAVLLAVASSAAWAQPAPARATVSADRTNVRSEPSIDASIVTAFASGQVVDVLEVRDSWTKVIASGKTGWVRSASLVSSASAAAPAATSRSVPTPATASPTVPRREVTPPTPVRNAPSPSKSGRGFEVGNTGLGPVIGFGGIGDASLAFGGRLEYALKELPDLGGGILGIGLDANYYSYSRQYAGFGGDVSWSYMPIGASANYHFKLDDRAWDPFLGLGLGYDIASVSGGGATYTASSALYFIGRAGVRYFFADRAAFQLDAGAGAATLSFGVIFKM